MARYRIPSPCPAAWDAMTPVPGGRHCDACDQVVVDLSDLDRRGVERYLRTHDVDVCAGGTCVRVRAEIVEDPPPPSRLGLAALTNGMAALLAFGAGGCDGAAVEDRGEALRTGIGLGPVAAPPLPPEKLRPPPLVTMGEMCEVLPPNPPGNGG